MTNVGRIWVSGCPAFVAAGLIVYAIMSLAIVAPIRSQKEALAKQLDEVRNGAARLLAEAKWFADNKSYDSARKTLDTLFEKKPGRVRWSRGGSSTPRSRLRPRRKRKSGMLQSRRSGRRGRRPRRRSSWPTLSRKKSSWREVWPRPWPRNGGRPKTRSDKIRRSGKSGSLKRNLAPC